LFALAPPIGVAELHIPGAVMFIFESGHLVFSFQFSVQVVFSAIEFFMEELAVNPAGNGYAAGLRQFFIHFFDEFVGVGFGNSQFCGNLIYSHKNLLGHKLLLSVLYNILNLFV